MWKMLVSAFDVLFAYKSECIKGKKPWLSKTWWVNVLALAGVLLSKYADLELTAEDTAAFLVAINLVLRLISKGSVGFYEERIKLP